MPTRVSDYSVREVAADMSELHDALGGMPAIWVGHSLGCTVGWAMATHQPERCRGVVNLTVPHFARGNVLANLVPFVDRRIYPIERFPSGQWDYMAFNNEHFTKAVRQFESHAAQLLDISSMPGSPDDVGKPAALASIRAQGGWFPTDRVTARVDPARTLLPAADRSVMLAAFARNGFSGPCAWYLNDDANIAFATEAPDYGRIALPVLFLGGEWDTVCDTAFGRLAEPMREDCSDLIEANVPAGHMLMLERPDDINRRISDWFAVKRLSSA